MSLEDQQSDAIDQALDNYRELGIEEAESKQDKLTKLGRVLTSELGVILSYIDGDVCMLCGHDHGDTDIDDAESAVAEEMRTKRAKTIAAIEALIARERAEALREELRQAFTMSNHHAFNGRELEDYLLQRLAELEANHE